jgi:hypothetical protein
VGSRIHRSLSWPPEATGAMRTFQLCCATPAKTLVGELGGTGLRAYTSPAISFFPWPVVGLSSSSKEPAGIVAGGLSVSGCVDRGSPLFEPRIEVDVEMAASPGGRTDHRRRESVGNQSLPSSQADVGAIGALAIAQDASAADRGISAFMFGKTRGRQTRGPLRLLAEDDGVKIRRLIRRGRFPASFRAN